MRSVADGKKTSEIETEEAKCNLNVDPLLFREA